MSATRTVRERRKSQGSKLPVIMLLVYIIWAVCVLLISSFALSNPVSLPAAGLFLVAEILLCVCLSRIPVWIHGLVGIFQIVLGFLFGFVLFMVLMTTIYMAALFLLYLWTKGR